MKQRLATFIAVALPVQLLLVQWIGSYPQFVETYYSKGLYPVLARGLRLVWGWVPFSVGDVLYLVLGILAVRYVYLHRKAIVKHPLRFGKNILAVLSIAYFVFHILWGMNYYRQPITLALGIKKEYTLKELTTFTKYLVQQANAYQLHLTGDRAVPVHIPYTQKEIFNKTKAGYAALQKNHPAFAYKTPSLKPSLFSTPLTYMGYGGYLNPFSNEAQVNAQLPLLRLPTVSGHEIGHQLGYAAEDATNFIGFWVTLYAKDPYFTYSAYLNAMRYSLSSLAVKDKKEYQNITALLHPGVKQNIEQINAFWQKHQNPLEPFFKSIFNAFLKVNNQQQGLKSYRAVVGLLLNYHNKKGFPNSSL